MRTSKTLGPALILGLLALIWLAPVAQACCIPCNPWCKTLLDPEDYCCTGIPEPGNACGLTICGKYLKRHDVAIDAVPLAGPPLTPAIQTDCGKTGPAFLAPVDEVEAQEEVEETGS